MDAYADVAALREWLGLAEDEPDPVNAERKLRSATIRVAAAGNVSPYDTPPAENAAALSDATCAQVAAWISLGIDPDAAGLDTAPVKRSSILDATVEHDTSGQADKLEQAAAMLAPEARAILLAAGLLWTPTMSGDTTPRLPDYGLGGAYAVGCGEVPVLVTIPPSSDWPFV